MDAIKEIERLTELAERLKLEAQIHAQEAATANATIAEIYQLCTGKTGEPGNWNGAEPVRQIIAARDAEIERLKKSLTDLKWRVDDIRDRLMGGGTGHSVYGIDEWSEPAVNLKLASKKIGAALNPTQGAK